MLTAIRGQITAMGEQMSISKAIISRGFIDLHVHGAMGRDTMQA